MAKKDKKSKKIPEQSSSEKVEYYKGLTRTVKKRVDNLEKRVYMLEQQLQKVKLSKEEVKCINSKDKKNSRKEFMEKWSKDE